MGEVFHGGKLDAAIAQYGGKREDWLDLSTGINPIPYRVPDIPSHAWSRLPDACSEQTLLSAARVYYQVPDHFEIVAAPGTQAIIERLPLVIGSQEVAIVSPTYGEHAHAWRKAGSKVTPTQGLSQEAECLVVVNPNNPTGKIWSSPDLLAASAVTRPVIVDEAFMDATPEMSVVPEMLDNMIILKSFGKFFGLAGVRLGFAICSAEIADNLREQLGPWAVSGPALEIGADAFQNQYWISNTISRLKNGSMTLFKVLKSNGFSMEAVNPLFVSAHHEAASAIQKFLATQHILVRPFPERSGYLRFGLCANDRELARLDAALKAFSSA